MTDEDIPTTLRSKGWRRQQRKNRESVQAPEVSRSSSHIYKQEPSRAGIFVTEKFAEATKRCEAKVKAIAAECRKNNLKFRDPEFNLADDKELCLYSLDVENEDWIKFKAAADVLRVPQIFDEPQFMINGAQSSNIEQGILGDCWFLSALTMLSSMSGSVEKICVARDEKVGVYGFIFCRDGEWVDVIIDDQLFTAVSKYEAISEEGKNLFHKDKDLFQRISRKGRKTLLFARSAQENETWVPLIEKAYAKFHGDYASLSDGYSSEAMEDMTGFVFLGVSDIFYVNDILDPDAFWDNDLKRVTKDRVFSCYMKNDDDSDSDSDADDWSAPNGQKTIDGLYTSHAYAVLGALEYKRKRFLKIRNPWGHSGWNGRWSDGSKEWTEEWLPLLKAINHRFGDDGCFIMEYTDFLNTWQSVERVKLFDNTWIQSAHWLNVKTRPLSGVWQYGDLSFTFAINKSTPAIIVLSQADRRFWDYFAGPFTWSFDFILFKYGQNNVVARSRVSITKRSVAIMTDLEEGDYFVHVRLDRIDSIRRDGTKRAAYERKMGRVQSQFALSHSMAANYRGSSPYMVIPEEYFSGGDLLKLETDNYEAGMKKRRTKRDAIFRRHNRSHTDGNIVPSDGYRRNLRLSHSPASSEYISCDEEIDRLPPTEEKHKVDHLADDVSDSYGPKGWRCDGNGGSDPSRQDVYPHHCNSCGVYIAGVRWKCHTCYTSGTSEREYTAYNLCDRCYTRGERSGPHKVDHHMIRLETPDSKEEVFTSFTCNACEHSPIIGEDVHPEHKMVKAENMDDAAVLIDRHNYNSDYILLGLRVFTKSHTKVNIDGQLRHGSMLSWGKEMSTVGTN
ncbi:cysteine proteinase [Hysterangium stoloniferum]|nr:cysteine proteinase [Hysterangium stoloniferum]